MAQNTAEERPEELTPEERESRDYAGLIRLYGDDPAFMSALAMAWRLGFIRHMRLKNMGDAMATINPFW